MSSSKQFVENHVPKLDSLNYQVWAGKMQAFLRSQGFWNIVRKSESSPPDLAEGFKPEHIALCKKERNDWSNQDDQAIGLIQLWLIDNLYDKGGVTSYRTWKSLEESFGTPGPAIIHTNFKKAINFKLTGANPAPEIASLFILFAHLKANKAELSKFYQVMLLIEVLPAKWDSLASAYMRKNQKVEDYKFIAFCDAMCAEWERQSGKKLQQHMVKLSTVKHKGKSPHFKDQKQKSDKQKANNQGDDNCNRQRIHKHGNCKGKGKAADTDHQHSHLASTSMMLVVETPPLSLLLPLPKVRFI
jgi:gag-polypeptide of LTR copia-type